MYSDNQHDVDLPDEVDGDDDDNNNNDTFIYHRST